MRPIRINPSNERLRTFSRYDNSENSASKVCEEMISAVLSQAIRYGMTRLALILDPATCKVQMKYGSESGGFLQWFDVRPPPANAWFPILKLIFNRTKIDTSWPLSGAIFVRAGFRKRRVSVSIPALTELYLKWDILEFRALYPCIAVPPVIECDDLTALGQTAV